MGDTMAADLADATSAEEAAIKTYKGLMAAKTSEVAATTATVEAKTQQIGELGVAIVNMEEDLSDTQASLKDDQQFLAELDKSCATKTAEWEERSKTRAEELVALADTIKVLNDDDALELFKKTLPSPSASFVQVQSTASSMRSRAMTAIRNARKVANHQDRPSLDLLSLALAGKKSATSGGFDKVLKMIDEMTDALEKEQRDDEDKKEYCAMQFDLSDDKKKELERTVDKEGNAMATAEEGIATLSEEIKALVAGIKALDKSVAEATEQRKEEHAEFKSLMASDTAAKEVLSWAKNRLNKFYNPKLYKPAPKAELSSEDRIVENMGGVVTTAAPGGIAGTGITVLAQVSAHSHSKDAPAPPPATWDAYAKKSGEGTGVIAMIDLLVKDLEKEMTEAETDEKNSQADYEQMMADAKEKRTTDSKALTEKGAAKADMEGELQAHTDAKAAGVKELMATEKYIHSLHAECDWLLQYFDVRKEARTGEIDSLKKGKAILSGADYSLVQQQRHTFLSRFH
jgi:chromosome segregation ATPase